MSGHLHSDFKIRIPDELKDKIRISSESNKRSMTADIVARLEQSFLKDFHSMGASFAVFIAAIYEVAVDDGRYTPEEAEDLINRTTQHMINPEFLSRYFESVKKREDEAQAPINPFL